jgi:hypothetical protein
MSARASYCPVCSQPYSERMGRYHRHGTKPSACRGCQKKRSAAIQAELAELVIAKNFVVKAAADRIGIGVKNAEFHLTQLMRRIRMQPRGT